MNSTDQDLITICQKAYLQAAVESVAEAEAADYGNFFMSFDGSGVMDHVYTTRAFLSLQISLYGSYIDPIKAFKKPMVDDGLIVEEFDEWFSFDFRLTDKGIGYLRTLESIEIEYNSEI